MPNQPLIQSFRKHLNQQRLSGATVKNYVSDVQVFLSWLSRQLQQDTIEPSQLSGRVFNDYCRWLISPASQVNPTSTQRYIFSLKHFGKWLQQSGLNESNPADELIAPPNPQLTSQTTQQLVSRFKAELVKQKLAASTIKNYVSDVNNYLLWATKHLKLTDSNSVKL